MASLAQIEERHDGVLPDEFLKPVTRGTGGPLRERLNGGQSYLQLLTATDDAGPSG
jgi:hypothetical protein